MPSPEGRLNGPRCRKCRGKGCVDKRIGLLPGAMARRQCPRCRGLGIELLVK